MITITATPQVGTPAVQDAARARAITAGVPTRQPDRWQRYADMAQVGWTTH
jgi:hypothetical protein